MQLIRRVFPWVTLCVVVLGFLWATSFGTPERAEFIFNNSTEVETIDPPRASGQPEGRVIDALFEGLCRDARAGDPVLDGFGPTAPVTDEDESAAPGEASADAGVDLIPGPGMATAYTISDDGRDYVFTIRDDAVWSDGEPVTADDFVFSWQRMLHPETISKYAALLYYIEGAQAYNEGTLAIDTPIEIELPDRLRPLENVPRGTIVRGKIVEIHRDQTADAILAKLKSFKADPDWDSFRGGNQEPANDIERQVREIYGSYGRERATSLADEASANAAVTVVEHPVNPNVTPALGGTTTAAQTAATVSGQRIAWTKDPVRAATHYFGPTRTCQSVLPDFEQTVKLKATDAKTLKLSLLSRTSFFINLTAFYPLYPSPRHCIAKHGIRAWTRPENVVSNGPYLLKDRRIRDRIELTKNDKYWNADHVALNRIDVLAVDQSTTALNMYLKGDVDWITTVPANLMDKIKVRDDFHSAPMLTVYFYRMNCDQKPTNDVRVRRALNMAVDKAVICEEVSRAGERPARHIVPDGMAGYTSPEGDGYDPVEAKRLIDEVRAEYAQRGEVFPAIEITFNTEDTHRKIAEVIQRQWMEKLSISVKAKNMEWPSYLKSMHSLDYMVIRAGWIGDYVDPNTFLDMWTTDNGNNETGYSNADYDKLIADAQAEVDPVKRLDILHQAEVMVLKDMPIIPIYFYVSKNMVNPRVSGFFNTLQDIHPLHLMRVDGPPAAPLGKS